MLVDVPQNVEAVQLTPAEGLVEAPVQRDAEPVRFFEVHEGLDRPERRAGSAVIQQPLALEEASKSFGLSQIGSVDSFSCLVVSVPPWLRLATSKARLSRAARRLCSRSPTVVLIVTGTGLENLSR